MTEKKKGFRLTKIYTRTGDKGQTRIGDGRQLSKSDARIEAIGTVDELNSWMGMLLYTLNRSNDLHPVQMQKLEAIQHRLFDLGGELAMPGYQLIREEFTRDLEKLIDELNAPLPPLENFTLPGGGHTACHAHMARTVARRAERRIIALAETGEEINAPLLSYINRLSDLLYVLARHCAEWHDGEVLWQPSEKKQL